MSDRDHSDLQDPNAFLDNTRSEKALGSMLPSEGELLQRSVLRERVAHINERSNAAAHALLKAQVAQESASSAIDQLAEDLEKAPVVKTSTAPRAPAYPDVHRQASDAMHNLRNRANTSEMPIPRFLLKQDVVYESMTGGLDPAKTDFSGTIQLWMELGVLKMRHTPNTGAPKDHDPNTLTDLVDVVTHAWRKK